MKEPIFEEIEDSEEYLHKEAWRVVQRQIAYAEANPTGSLYDDLVAMIFAFHCLEGYLNFVLENIAPDLWQNEKEEFKRTGFEGKLRKVHECCGISMPDKGRRPFSTVSELKKLRDRMVHPKTHKQSQITKFLPGRPPPLFKKPFLSTLVSHPKAVRSRDDVKCIADQIHLAARKKFPDVNLGQDALDGMLSMRTSSTKKMDVP